MTKRKVQFSETTEEANDGRPEQKSRRFKDEHEKEENEKDEAVKTDEVEIEGQWVEVTPHPKKRNTFSCTDCVRSFAAAESSMKHFHWCDPNHHVGTSTSTEASSSVVTQKKQKSPPTSKTKQKAPKKVETIDETPKKPLLADVKDVVKDMITRVTPESVHQTERRGADTRKKYTNIEKVRIITEVYNGGKPVDVADKYGINRSLISKWLSKKDVLLEAIQSSEKKCFDTKNRRKNKYENLYRELHTQFLAGEAQGVVISYRWIYECAEKIYKEYFPDGILPQSFVSNFTKRFDLQYQKKYKQSKNKSTEGAEGTEEDVKSPSVRWHSNSRQVPASEKINVPPSFTSLGYQERMAQADDEVSASSSEAATNIVDPGVNLPQTTS